MALAQFFTILAGVLGLAALAVYLFGIPPEMKRKLERQALQTMGENKMSYMAKDQLSKIPASDQEDVKQFKQGLGNSVGGAMNNPVGDATGRAAGQAWGAMQGLSKTAFDRVSTLGQREQNKAQE